MNKENRKNPVRKKTHIFHYSILVLVAFSLVTMKYDIIVGTIELVVSFGAFVLSIFLNRMQTKNMLSYVEDMFINMDSAATSSVIDLPIPMVILESDGTITWYNEEFRMIFGNDVLFDINISSLIENDDLLDSISKGVGHISIPVKFDGKHYNVLGTVANVDPEVSGKHLTILYWYDETDLIQLKEKYINEKTVEWILMIDNYDDLMQNTSDINRQQLLAQADSYINSFAKAYNGVLKQFERDKYILLIENRWMEEIKHKKFELLDAVREINVGNKIPITMSIGIGMGGKTGAENDAFARKAVDMALGRGGDQVVIKEDSNYAFYGGKSKAYEKSTRVKARVVSSALKQLISDADEVFIMGHRNADIDCFGAALALSRAVRTMDKQVHIVLETYDYTVKCMLKRLESSEDYNGLFITGSQALGKANARSLVIVADTHKPTMVECPDLLLATDKIMIIDHHRRGTEFIDNAALVYHEPYASSTSEMTTEILLYIDDKISLTKMEAEALYAGIKVDTRDFTFKTGVRTFDAASYLKKAGVDTVSVEKLFQSSMEMIVNRSEIVRLTEVYRENIAISSLELDIDDAGTVIAQAADDMLKISGIAASFVVAQIGTNVSISARSLGDINVQVITEKLGGGGHLAMAGVQLKMINAESATVQLKNAIDEYLNEI